MTTEQRHEHYDLDALARAYMTANTRNVADPQHYPLVDATEAWEALTAGLAQHCRDTRQQVLAEFVQAGCRAVHVHDDADTVTCEVHPYQRGGACLVDEYQRNRPAKLSWYDPCPVGERGLHHPMGQPAVCRDCGIGGPLAGLP